MLHHVISGSDLTGTKTSAVLRDAGLSLVRVSDRAGTQAHGGATFSGFTSRYSVPIESIRLKTNKSIAPGIP